MQIFNLHYSHHFSQYPANFKMQIYLKIAQLYLEDGDAVEADAFVNRASMLQAEVNRRAFEEVFGDPRAREDALEAYAAAVAAAPSDPAPAAGLAGFLLDLGRDEEALGAAEHALSIEPNFILARRMRLEALRRLGRGQEEAAAARDLQSRLRELKGYVPRNGYEERILDRGSEVASRG